ncbi:RagB/SusD family nutrient uptake outer membrane protein [Limibacter armeniacum]|uniref:RagB/SusD family nutrient uptake outer membrane protein n=1 Tax=Limibacter armeniacum TaxID=466084 RepID=UPI002FE533E0
MKFRNRLITVLAAGALMATAPACTNLDEELYSSIPADEYFTTPEELQAGINPVYASLRSLYHHEDFWGFNQVSSDETIVPARGGDWYDGGKWLQLNAHTWDANHPHLQRMWNNPYTGIARANSILELMQTAEQTPDVVAGQAEVRFLRGFYYYILMDMFGGVPVITASEHDGKSAPSTRAQVYEFIVTELEGIKDQLPETPQYGRAGKAAAYAMLMKLYLNSGVYTSDGYNVSTPSAEALQKVVEYAKVIEGMGYSLYSNYLDTFKLENEGSNKENIFTITYIAQAGLGNHGNCWGMHYDTRKLIYDGKEVEVGAGHSQWNGFSVMPDHYDSFSDDDNRKSIFYTQFETVDGTVVEHTNDVPLRDANKLQGVRVLKWEIDPKQPGIDWGGDGGTDFAVLRFADVLLMHAEAEARMGNDAEALSIVNELRTQGGRFKADSPIADATAHMTALSVADVTEFILMERGWELCWEGVRRQDLIRYGKFLDAWQNKQMENDGASKTVDGEVVYLPSAGKPSDAAKRIVFPIPTVQVSLNPNLNQSTGY